MFWNRQDLLLMMGTEIFKIDAPWSQKLMKMRVPFLMTPTVVKVKAFFSVLIMNVVFLSETN